MDTHSPKRSEKASLSEAGTFLQDPYGLLLAVGSAISEARTGAEALGVVYEILAGSCGLRAVAMEVMCDTVMRFQPYGDALALPLDDTLPESCRKIPFSGALAPAGEITFVHAPGSWIPPGLQEMITAQIGQKLALESLAARAEAADDRSHQRISEVATIYEIGQAIDQIELPSLIQMITDRAALLMDAQTCSFMRFNELTGILRVEASHGLPDEALAQEQKIGEGIAGRVAQTEQPILIVAGERDSRLEGVTLRPEIGSSMLVPMKRQDGRVLGVLSIRRRRPAADFTDADLKLFSVFATQAALALTNLQLYEDVRQRANELGKLSTLSRALISTIDLEELLRHMADDIVHVVGFARCCLYIHDSIRHVFVPRIWRGYPEAIGRNPVREREGVVGCVGRDRELLYYHAQEPVTLQQDTLKSYLQRRGFARSLGTDSFVAVPILTGKNECLGVVVADNRSNRNPISPEQIRLLSAYTSQAGIAIDNALLYVRTQEDYHKIRRLTEYTENVLQSIPAGILSTDGRGVVVRWNRATEVVLRLSSGALRGASLMDVIRKMCLPEQEENQLLDLITHVLETGESIHQHKLTPRLGQNTITLNVNLSRLADHNQERGGLVMSLEDVTQEVNLGAQVERMRRLADIGQLAAKMAHEVRNALSPIKGAAQIIRLELEAQHAGTEWPDIIIAEVDGLSQLTSAMLDFARPTPLDPRPVDVSEFLVGAVTTLSSFLAEHQTRVRWELPGDLPEISADPVQLGQVVRNLVMNASQSMPDGGELVVSVEFDRHSSSLVLKFRDEGPGIAPEDLDRIFRPFVTTKPKGSGLGLPIVHKIVSNHGGKVEVESKIGEGTCFSVILPLLPPRDRSELAIDESPLISAQPTGPFPDN